MNQLKTPGIVLSRINFRETDRIIVVITPDYGKISLIAKGSRSLKSKLAGGIELFTINDLNFVKGRGEVATLISSRLSKNFANIIKDIERVQLGYELLKIIDRTTEDQPEPEFYYLLANAISGLDDLQLPISVVRFWFLVHLIAQSGHAPNLLTDSNNNRLSELENFGFDDDRMSFKPDPKGRYTVNDIKFFRVALTLNSPKSLGRVNKASDHSLAMMPLVNSMRSTHIYS